MTRLEILTVIILRYHAWQDRHESPEDWQARAGVIAQAIDAVSRNNEEAAFLTYMGKHESGFALIVHSGRKRQPRLGHSYFSLWQISNDYFWVSMWTRLSVGLDSTTECAATAIDLYRTHRGTGTLIDGIRGYGGYSKRSLTPRILARRVTKIRREIEARI
jgi:hypothetical protein